MQNRANRQKNHYFCATNPANMKLRKANISDIDHICRIIGGAQVQMARLGIDQWQNGYPDRSAIEEDILYGAGYLLDDAESGEIAAYCAAIFDGEPTYARIYDGEWLTAGSDYVVVHRLAVADKFKHRGIATNLLRQIEDIARNRGVASFRIDTHNDNDYMHIICARLGFSRCGIIHVSDGTPRVAYEKLLR